MKPSEVRDMSADQLAVQLLDLRKKHMDFRFELIGGQIKSTALMRTARRDIARIKTEMNARKKTSSAPEKLEAKPKTESKTEEKK